MTTLRQRVAQLRMDMARLWGGVASTALVIGYAIGSGLWVTTGDSWYRSLDRPPWQPPDAVVGIIWPYNFAALIAAGIAVAGGMVIVGSEDGSVYAFGAAP